MDMDRIRACVYGCARGLRYGGGSAGRGGMEPVAVECGLQEDGGLHWGSPSRRMLSHFGKCAATTSPRLKPLDSLDAFRRVKTGRFCRSPAAQGENTSARLARV